MKPISLRNQIYCNLILSNSKLLRHTSTHPLGRAQIAMGCQRRSVFIDFTTRTHPHPPPRLLFFICRYLLFDFSDSKHIPIQSLFIKCNWLRFLSIPSKLYPPARCRNLFRIRSDRTRPLFTFARRTSELANIHPAICSY